MALTVAWLNSKLNKPTPDNKIIRKSDSNGFAVRVSPKGKITFTYRYRFEGKQSSVDIGQYPIISLTDARSKALHYAKELSLGHNPTDYKFNRGKRFQTFKDYVEAWEKDYLSKKKTSGSAINLLKNHIYPTFGNVVVGKTTTGQWMRMFKDFLSTTTLNSTSLARLLPRMNQALNYATKHYELPYNPIAPIKNSDFDIRAKVRKRLLTDDEIVQLFHVLDNYHCHKRYARFVRLSLYTGARGIELLRAKVADFDLELGLWLIPDENSKNGEAFYRPLTPETLTLVKEQIKDTGTSEFLFTKFNGQVAKESFRQKIKAMIIDRYSRVYPDQTINWTMHDFRRTFRTNVSRWIKRESVAEMCLGHKQSGIHAVYNLYEYLDEMKDIYTNWTNHLVDLETKAKAISPVEVKDWNVNQLGNGRVRNKNGA